VVFLKSICTALFMLVASHVAYAAEHTLVMHHMELQPLQITTRVGDIITFDNQSDMTHNLYVTYSDGSVDNLDTQIPGVQRKLTLRVGGPAIIKCWIHPIIRLDVEIAPQADPASPK
jgi:plastocyanin